MNEELPLYPLKDHLGEASALLPCGNTAVRKHYRLDRAFWALKEEGPVDEALVLIGHKRDHEAYDGWLVRPARTRLSVQRDTEDAEMLARDGDWIYLLSSQSGGSDGVLKLERTVVGRFSESAVRPPLTTGIEIEVANRPFMIHRAVNDALKRSGLDFIPLAPHAANSFVLPTLEEGYAARSAWAPRLQIDDYPLRVDGLAFLADGSALLGLRFPMTAAGEPLLIRIDDLTRCFSESEALIASVAGFLPNAGETTRPAGVRAIQAAAGTNGGQVIDVLTGPLGLMDRRDALANDYPGSETIPCRHWRLALPQEHSAAEPLQAELIREFEERGVEALAEDPDGHWHYTICAEGETSIAIAECR